ncbi:MAG: NAD+ synthase [Bacteroidetes bacterium CG2_30_33_31]|nr:MAG: NAD+ synthase [Bacteroidetes bacterium CG2_30_33_31]
MKIAICQLNFHIGNFANNEKKILDYIHKSESQKADLVIFPELSITGYPPRDFLEFNDFIDKVIFSLQNIATHCKNIAALIGAPSRNETGKGKPLFNSAYFLFEGRVKQVFNKTLLPNYDIFDEYRYFEPNKVFELLKFKGKNIAVTVCEDLWNIDDNPLYYSDPMKELAKLNPDFIINIAASPFHSHQAEIRKDVLKRNCLKYQLPIIYVNHVGAQTELIFDGGSMAINSKANIVKSLKYFEEDYDIVDISNIESLKAVDEKLVPTIALIHDALVLGIKNYFQKLGFTKAILGLSGGIDSAITLVLAAEALGKENVLSILMPSQFSSCNSIIDSVQLADNLAVNYETIYIEDAFRSFESTLKPYFDGLPFNIAEENLQARIRGVLLMAFTNKFGYILLNTSNKSEAAVGYGTLYGDMNGGLSVIGDLYKTQVFELAHYINRDKEIIPANIISKPPSAELKPDQKDSDSLPDYFILDRILFHYIEERKGPQEIISLGFDKEIVNKTLKMVNISEHKRYQTPPILRVSPKAFGMGRRIPIVAKYLS